MTNSHTKPVKRDSQDAPDQDESGLDGSGLTLGERLRHARESQKLSLADVAERLCFTKQRITQMESDDYTHAASKAYARGYLASYAKLLGLPLDEALVDFDALKLYEQVAPKRSQLAVASLEQPSGLSRHVRLVSFAVAAVLVVLVVLWLHGLGRPSTNSMKPLAAATPDFTGAPDFTAQTAALSKPSGFAKGAKDDRGDRDGRTGR